VRWRGSRMWIDVEQHQATHHLEDGIDSLMAFRHHDEEATVMTAQPVTLPIRRHPPMLARPSQPPGREASAWTGRPSKLLPERPLVGRP
jgi:alpha,alpha-trehalose phosphorylase